MAKLTVEDLGYLLKEDDEQGGNLRKQMASTAHNAINYWSSILEVVGADAAPKQRKKREKSADGKTHGDAILEALKGAKSGLTSAAIRTKMEKAEHPINVTSFHATMQNLVKAKSVTKRKKEKGSRDNVYTAK